jgi:hypothetical protein
MLQSAGALGSQAGNGAVCHEGARIAGNRDYSYIDSMLIMSVRVTYMHSVDAASRDI